MCIDIENVFLAKLDLHDDKDFENFIKCEEPARNFIVIENKDFSSCSDKSKCRNKKINGKCPCEIKVYNIRPYTFEIIGALQQFFEIVAIAFLPYSDISHIIDHFEKILN